MKRMQNTGIKSKLSISEMQKSLISNMHRATLNQSLSSDSPEEQENAVVKQLLVDKSRECRMLRRQLALKEKECRLANQNTEKLYQEYKALSNQYYAMRLRAEALLAEVQKSDKADSKKQ